MHRHIRPPPTVRALRISLPLRAVLQVPLSYSGTITHRRLPRALQARKRLTPLLSGSISARRGGSPPDSRLSALVHCGFPPTRPLPPWPGTDELFGSGSVSARISLLSCGCSGLAGIECTACPAPRRCSFFLFFSCVQQRSLPRPPCCIEHRHHQHLAVAADPDKAGPGPRAPD